MSTVAKQQADEAHEQMRAQFLAGGTAADVLRSRTTLVDAAVLDAYHVTLGKLFPSGLTLLAVGGYGRRELFPYSDIDLILLMKEAPEAGPEKDALSEFLRTLWDLGFRVSQSVRSIEECCSVTEGNFELTVSLLDQRMLIGDRSLYGQFREKFARFLSSERRDLTRRLCRMTRARQAKHHNTIYRLEPDIKEHPGGLRDLQTIRWLGTLREAGGGEVDERALEFLYSVRCYLHYRANRDSNQLTFDAQDDLAHAPFSKWPDPAEWMQAYFRHASTLWRAVKAQLEVSETQDRSLLANFRDWRSRLSNSDFTVSRDRILLRNPHDLEVNPSLPLQLFLFVARHGIPLAVDTERRIAQNLPQLARHYLQPQPLAPFWKELFAQKHGLVALRAMQDTGFLVALIPEWARIEHRVTRDFYHQYTVDEHTMVTLEVLAELRESQEPGGQRYKGLLDESDDLVWVLSLALMLHDIGKGSGRDHSEEAVRMAGGILARMGVSEADAELVVFLIARHLDLSSLMQTRDLHDPDTARQTAAKVKTIERLRLLTLLTYADISAVNPSAMSPWRMEQLWRLYRVASRELTGGLTAERIDTPPQEAYGNVGPAMKEFLDGLPTRYVWTHSVQQAQAHAALYSRAKETGTALDVSKREGIYHLSVAASDRPFLFASICGALSSFGLNILKAEAFSNRHGYIIDGFSFSDPARTLDLNPPEMERLRVVLGRVVLGEVRAEDLLKHRPKKTAPSRLGAIEPSVTCDSDNSGVATVFEVVAQDRAGLLYDLAAAISRANCNIEVVLVDTEAHKAIDVFHVTSGGAKLRAADAEKLRAELLDACRP